MNERIDRQELEALEGLVDVVFDAAEWVKAMEGPSRWLVISGRFPDAGQRIVLETSRPAPHFWWHPEWPHRDDDWIVPALILEIERPWLLEAWVEADPWPGCELRRARRGDGGAVLRGCRDHRSRLPRGLHQDLQDLVRRGTAAGTKARRAVVRTHAPSRGVTRMG
jgi:hypothetical protein